MPAVTVEALTKRYDDVVAINDLTFSVREGEVYGLIGPNGSGKTTVLNVLLDFARPSSGSAAVFDHDVTEESLAVRRRIGVVPEGYGVYDRLTGRQHVRFAAESKGAHVDPEAILDRVGLVDAADRPAGEYSAGMAKRLVLGTALAGDPDLLVFDEPFGGLDPGAAATLRGVIAQEQQRGTTVLFSSHLFGSVETICDRFGMLLEGELVAQHDLAEFRSTELASLSVAVEEPQAARRIVGDVAGVTEASEGDRPDTVDVQYTPGSKAAVLAALYTADVTVTEIDIENPSLADVYMEHATGGASA